jgi:hypothetical protein
MALWAAKGMGVLFGGVTDEDRDEETLESVFHRDLHVIHAHLHRHDRSNAELGMDIKSLAKAAGSAWTWRSRRRKVARAGRWRRPNLGGMQILITRRILTAELRLSSSRSVLYSSS